MKNLRTILFAAAASLLTAVLVAQGQVPGVNSSLNTVFTLAYDNSTMKPTYSASQAGITAVASQTDMCSMTGSATKTIKVRRIFFDNVPTTAVTEPIAIVKRSTATTGAGTALAKVPYDSANAASTVALAEVWTAAPTVGTIVGVLADLPQHFAIATSADSGHAAYVFGQLGQPIVLRGVAQQVAINLNATTFTGTVSCTFEWTEE